MEPPYLFPAYASTQLRAPLEPLFELPVTLTERTGPLLGSTSLPARSADLTRQHGGEPLGERIIVQGRVLDVNGAPIAGQLVEIWQANAAGRYAHEADEHSAPLDPNFTGGGRCVTDGSGAYRFVTIRPGAYPWRNHHNAWRPAHIHFSTFGRSFRSRLVTQMYFPGDPLLEFDPIIGSIPDREAARRLVCSLDLDATEPEWALAYRFDIVLPGDR